MQRYEAEILENAFFDLEGIKQEVARIQAQPELEPLSEYLADCLLHGEYSAPQVKQLVRAMEVEPCARLTKLLGGIDSFSALSRLKVTSFKRLKNTVNGNAMFVIQCEVLRAGDSHRLLVSTGETVELFAVPDAMENCSISGRLAVQTIQRQNPIIRANVSRYARRVRVHDVIFEREFYLQDIA